MRKMLSVSLVPLEAGRLRPLVLIGIVFAFLVGIVPAQAQIFAGQYGPADQLLQSNLNMVDRWMWYGDMYGYTRGGNFYGMYDRNGRRLSRSVRIAVAGAEIGATIGYAKGGGKGALIGAGIGAAPGLIIWAFNKGNKQDEVVDLPDQILPPPTGGPQTPQAPGRETGWNHRLRQQQAGAYQRGQVGGRPVNNRTGLDILLWVGDSLDAIEIPRGGHKQVPRNPGGMDAETVETAPGGHEVRKPALVVPNHYLDGWNIIVPAGR